MRNDTAVSSALLKRDPDCTRCGLHETAQYVCLLGQGPISCDVMVIGEAPGRREDDSGKPFVGEAGQYLDGMFEETKLQRSRMFITNAVSCRPPGNRTPKKREIDACNHWLKYQMQRVKPKYVLLLGNVALQALTGEKGIKKARGKPFVRDGVTYLPTYHPSFIKRGDYKDEPIFRNDLRLFKLLIEGGGIPEEKALSIIVVTNENTWRQMLKALRGTVSFDIETTGLYPWAKKQKQPNGEWYPKGNAKKPDPRSYDARVVSIGFGTREHQYLIPTHLFDLDKKRAKELQETLADCVVVAHNGKFDSLWMLVHYNIFIRIDFDTMVAHFLLDENTTHGLKDLAQRFCDAPNWDVEGEAKHEWSERLKKYHAHDLYYTRRLKFVFHRMLAEDDGVSNVFRKIMMPCVEQFTWAEFEGIFVEEDRMDEVELELKKTIKRCEKELNKYGKINWGSPQQLAALLFDKLKLPVIEKTKGGARSTSESVLKRLDHPLVKALLDLRGAKQQLSFFIEGWRAYIVNGRLHPSFKLTGTVTGRLSCENPNLQQTPRDKTIRTLVGAPKGWVLIEADLSQIELRIAAELAGERALLEMFLTGKDPHWMTALDELERGRGEYKRVLATASKLKKKTIKDYEDAIAILREAGPDACIEADFAWKELRKKAKAVNFGYLFGMWWVKFKDYARDKYDVILTDEQAQESRESFFELYRDLPSWHKRQRKFAHKHGYARTLSGRLRRLPRAMDEELTMERKEAERQAINSPVQSFANEWNLMGLLHLTKEFSREVYRPVGTVHDSILAYARADWAERIGKRTLEVMRHPELLDKLDISIQVPIESDVSVGNWGDGTKFEKWANDNQSRRRAA